MDQVVDLTTRVLGIERTHEEEKEQWRWKFERNPFASECFPHAWVLEHKGRIVGNTGQIAIPIKLGKRVVIGYENCDYAVEEGYRTYGIRLANKFWRNSEAPLLITTSANETSHHIFKALGAKELNQGRDSWYKVMHSRKVLDYIMAGKNGMVRTMLDHGWLLTAISGPLDLALKIGSSITYRRSGEAFQVKVINSFGSEFDILWREISQYYPVLVVRDSKYLNWRYIDYPGGKLRILSAYDGRGKLRGFSVVEISLSSDLKTAVIKELFTRPDDLNTRRALLQSILIITREERVDMVAAPLFDSQTGIFLAKNAFLRRRKIFTQVLFRNNREISSDLLSQDKTWFISPGDME